MQPSRTKISIALVLIFTFGFAGMCDKGARKTISTATDDFAEAQVSTANLLATAKTNGLVSQEDINEIKPFLLEANTLNDEAIKYGRQLSSNPTDATAKQNLIDTLNRVSAALVRANNAGLTRIKDPATRAAFSGLVVTMQAAATSIIVIVKR